MTKVSIIIPFYNCPYIDQAVESALDQSYANLEIIVVDDGSTLYTNKLAPYLNRIKYIKKENGGTASALNIGIKHAAGEYFCWLSSDDLFLPEKIETQLERMIQENASVSYTNFYTINENNRITSPPMGTHFPSRLDFIKLMRKGNFINGCSIMIKMDDVMETGLFDESLPYTHDYDLWLRLAAKHSFLYIREPLLLYRVHSGMGSKVHAAAIKKETKMVSLRHRPAMNQIIQQLRNG